MLFRDLTESDLEDCAKLHQESFDKSWSKAELENLLKNPHITGFCAEKNTVITAFILYQHILDEVEIYTICVRASYKRQGIGTALLNVLEKKILSTITNAYFLRCFGSKYRCTVTL